MNESQPSNPGILRVDVKGKSPVVWEANRKKLLHAIERVLDQIGNNDDKTAWFKEQAKVVTSSLMDHARARLAKAGLENERIEAEVSNLYAQREKELAVARKTHAEAESTELDNAAKQLRLILSLTKVMLLGDTSEEAILFGQQIDAMMDDIKCLMLD